MIKSIGKAIIKGADDITIALLKKLDAEDTYRAFVKFRQTLHASTEEAVATINGWIYLWSQEAIYNLINTICLFTLSTSSIQDIHSDLI